MFYLERPNDVPGTWYSEDHGGFVNGFDNATPYASAEFAEQIIVDLDLEDPENVRVVYHEQRDEQQIADADISANLARLNDQVDLLTRMVQALMDASGIELPEPEPTEQVGGGIKREG